MSEDRLDPTAPVEEDVTAHELAAALGSAVGQERAEAILSAARASLLPASGQTEAGSKTSEYKLATLALVLGVVSAIAGVYFDDPSLKQWGYGLAGLVTTAYIGGRSVRKGLGDLRKPSPKETA